MESQFWGLLEAHPFFIVVLIIGGLIAVASIVTARAKIHDALGYKTRYELDREDYLAKEAKRDQQTQDIWKEIKDMRRETKESFNELRTDLRNVKNANIMVLGDRISQKASHYLSLGAIPADEMVEFQGMYDTYKSIGGNHGVDIIYEKTLSALTLSSQQSASEE